MASPSGYVQNVPRPLYRREPRLVYLCALAIVLMASGFTLQVAGPRGWWRLAAVFWMAGLATLVAELLLAYKVARQED